MPHASILWKLCDTIESSRRTDPGGTISNVSAPDKSKSKTFEAALERFSGNGLNWIIARLPFSVEKTWGVRGLMKVHVRVNAFDYRTSLFPTGRGEHFILVNKKVQKGARIFPGSVAAFSVTPDLTPRTLDLPRELREALHQERALRQWFDRLSYSIRKWLSDIVGDAKSPQVRIRRAERVAEQVMEAMEAEHELPPMIRLEFAKIPGAERTWKKMTAIQRRHNLLAIFYYRTPQSRTKRIHKIFEEPSAE